MDFDFTHILTVILTCIGSASVIGHSLTPVVKLTKTEKDDKLLAKFNKGIAFIKNIIDKLGLNTKK